MGKGRQGKKLVIFCNLYPNVDTCKFGDLYQLTLAGGGWQCCSMTSLKCVSSNVTL